MSSPPPSSPQFPSLSLTAKAVSGNDYEEYGLDRTAVMMSLGTTGSETTSAPSSPSSPCGSSLGSSPVSIISTTGASPDMDYSRRIFAQTQHSLDQQYSLQYTGIRQDLRASLKVEAENLMEEIPGTTNSPIQLRGSSYSQSTKRKATWQDDESLEHSDPPISTSSFLNEFAPDGSGKSMSLMQQSTRNTILGDHNGSFEHHYSTANFTELDYRPQDDTEPMILTPADSTYGQMSVDVSAANSVQDFGDDDVDEGAFMRSNLSLPKRSRSRLDTQAIHAGGLSEIEVRRQESGQRTLDIFQQCFYNAAAASW
ncbi:hypothetical protein BGZ54_005498 [Gamsiella multidivaricata]|nr:hypothetical protein BGZ54_005498 [Gamsiella multidivaricata]